MYNASIGSLMGRTTLYLIGAAIVVAIAYFAETTMNQNDTIPIREMLLGVYALLPGLARWNSDKKKAIIVPQKDFWLGRDRLILYGTLGTFACLQLGGFFTVFISEYVVHQIPAEADMRVYVEISDAIQWVSLFSGLVLAVPLLFVMGRWIGSRTKLSESSVAGSNLRAPCVRLGCRTCVPSGCVERWHARLGFVHALLWPLSSGGHTRSTWIRGRPEACIWFLYGLSIEQGQQ